MTPKPRSSGPGVPRQPGRVPRPRPDPCAGYTEASAFEPSFPPAATHHLRAGPAVARHAVMISPRRPAAERPSDRRRPAGIGRTNGASGLPARATQLVDTAPGTHAPWKPGVGRGDSCRSWPARSVLLPVGRPARANARLHRDRRSTTISASHAPAAGGAPETAARRCPRRHGTPSAGSGAPLAPTETNEPHEAGVKGPGRTLDRVPERQGPGDDSGAGADDPAPRAHHHHSPRHRGACAARSPSTTAARPSRTRGLRRTTRTTWRYLHPPGRRASRCNDCWTDADGSSAGGGRTRPELDVPVPAAWSGQMANACPARASAP